MPKSTKKLIIEISEGQVARNLLENGFLDYLSKWEVLLLVPVVKHVYFDKFKKQNIQILEKPYPQPLSRKEKYYLSLAKVLNKKGRNGLRQRLWEKMERPVIIQKSQWELNIIEQESPDLVISTHLSQLYGRGLIAVAQSKKIPTLGLLMSWDNVWKGLKSRPDMVACWSENNKDEIMRMEGYADKNVQVTGAPGFDAYFAEDAQWTREFFCSQLGLDSDKPIIMYATLGQFAQQVDETNTLEVLLRNIDSGNLSKHTQVIVRMHPWSRDGYFKHLLDHPNVTLSRYWNYVPGLTWTPTREETILAGNLLKHANVIVSPGSTMCIEAAIFDTPIVVPVFNEYMPDFFDQYFEETWLKKHFSKLYINNWLPVVRNEEDYISGILKAIDSPSWYQNGRMNIRNHFLGTLDGNSTLNLANLINK